MGDKKTKDREFDRMDVSLNFRILDIDLPRQHDRNNLSWNITNATRMDDI